MWQTSSTVLQNTKLSNTSLACYQDLWNEVLPISPAETNVGSSIYQGSGTGNMAPYASLMKRANVVYCQHIHAVALRTV